MIMLNVINDKDENDDYYYYYYYYLLWHMMAHC